MGLSAVVLVGGAGAKGIERTSSEGRIFGDIRRSTGLTVRAELARFRQIFDLVDRLRSAQIQPLKPYKNKLDQFFALTSNPMRSLTPSIFIFAKTGPLSVIVTQSV